MSESGTLSPAFKEWRCIVESLGQGGYSLILRKGGIAEGREGFRPIHDRFWLFPTEYHQQGERTKAAARPFLDLNAPKEPSTVRIEYLAKSLEVRYVTRWEKLMELDSYHLWNEPILRERFVYGGEDGLHLLLVRVYRLGQPRILPLQKAYEGCKSWIEIPVSIEDASLKPVLAEGDFDCLKNEIVRKW